MLLLLVISPCSHGCLLFICVRAVNNSINLFLSGHPAQWNRNEAFCLIPLNWHFCQTPSRWRPECRIPLRSQFRTQVHPITSLLSARRALRHPPLQLAMSGNGASCYGVVDSPQTWQSFRKEESRHHVALRTPIGASA